MEKYEKMYERVRESPWEVPRSRKKYRQIRKQMNKYEKVREHMQNIKSVEQKCEKQQAIPAVPVGMEARLRPSSTFSNLLQPSPTFSNRLDSTSYRFEGWGPQGALVKAHGGSRRKSEKVGTSTKKFEKVAGPFPT